MLRIVGGKASGCRLIIPDSPGVRPATDRLRESLFAHLKEHVRDAHVLDLFAGSGVIGLEAVSRGAASCLFMEKDRAVVRDLQRNIKAVGLPRRCRVLSHDLAQPLPHLGDHPFDLVFLDPPFAFFRGPDGLACVADLIRQLMADWVAPQGRLVLRHEDRDAASAEALVADLGLESGRLREYGRSHVRIFKTA